MSEATGEEFSESMLSRFENGQSEMSAQKLFACLDNIYLDIEEYNLLVREYEPTDFSTLQKNIHHFYNPYNEIELEKLAKKELDKIKIDGREQYHRLNNILIKARIKSVNNNYFISDDLIEYLKNYLFSMVNWANYELTLFSETIHLFEPNAFLNYCQEMLHRSDFYKRLSYNSAIIQTILINGVFYSVEKNRLEDALILIETIKQNFSQTRDAYLKIVFMIAKGYYLTKFDKNKGIFLIKKGINIFKDLGYEEISTYYYNEFKNIID
ncbi:DNA-binding protein [Streptococcus equi subsp. zooepidemicus Sz57]|nr:DNA-binding protein [Streptococcus equi subsp. zooepidemicus Sz57]